MSSEAWRLLGHLSVYAGLLGEVFVVFAPETKPRLIKSLSVAFAVSILLGVWCENHADAICKEARSVSEVDAETTVSELREFKSVRVTIFAYTSTPDSIPLANELDVILKAAKWDATAGTIASEDRSVVNVLIELGKNASQEAKDAGAALARNLSASGVPTTFSGLPRPPVTGLFVGPSTEPDLYVTIGPKVC